eukprot:gene2301-3025_t
MSSLFLPPSAAAAAVAKAEAAAGAAMRLESEAMESLNSAKEAVSTAVEEKQKSLEEERGLKAEQASVKDDLAVAAACAKLAQEVLNLNKERELEIQAEWTALSLRLREAATAVLSRTKALKIAEESLVETEEAYEKSYKKTYVDKYGYIANGFWTRLRGDAIHAPGYKYKKQAASIAVQRAKDAVAKAMAPEPPSGIADAAAKLAAAATAAANVWRKGFRGEESSSKEAAELAEPGEAAELAEPGEAAAEPEQLQ